METKIPILRIGERVPTVVSLRAASSGETLAWGLPSLGASVLVLAGSDVDAKTRRYIEQLEERRPRFDSVGGRLVVVLENSPDAGYGSELLPVIATDPEGKLRPACGLDPNERAVLIADRWGELYEITTEASDRPWPSAAQVEEWLYFLAMQCPECGVVDEARNDEWDSG